MLLMGLYLIKLHILPLSPNDDPSLLQGHPIVQRVSKATKTAVLTKMPENASTAMVLIPLRPPKPHGVGTHGSKLKKPKRFEIFNQKKRAAFFVTFFFNPPSPPPKRIGFQMGVAGLGCSDQKSFGGTSVGQNKDFARHGWAQKRDVCGVFQNVRAHGFDLTISVRWLLLAAPMSAAKRFQLPFKQPHISYLADWLPHQLLFRS